MLDQCKASANTKVHVSYCKGLQALGTVNQSKNADQWTFLAALPFYAGHPGNVTLSNEGTEPGTLAVFDQVRFTWSGKSCSKVDSHPRQAQIRFSVNFKNVASRQAEFGSALKKSLSQWANIPETALRLTSLRSGSIIASILVLPTVVDDPDSHFFHSAAPLSASHTIKKISDAVAKNSDGLCGLTGQMEGCKVEFTDLGVAKPTIFPEYHQNPQRQQEEEKPEAKPEAEEDEDYLLALIAAGALLCMAMPMAYYVFKHLKAKKKYDASNMEASKASSMEEGKAIDEKKHTEDENDNASTLAPSSDKQSEASLNGGVDDDAKSNLSIVKALNEKDI